MSSPFAIRLKQWFIYHSIRFFRMRGSNEKAARGFAVGLACNFLPTFGFGALLSGFLAKLVRGNVVAGFIGGSLLAIFWPALFYLNIQVGGHFIRPPVMVDHLEDVTPQTVCALVWGKTFAIGAAINGLVIGLAAYFLFLSVYERYRPHALRLLRLRLSARRRPGTPA